MPKCQPVACPALKQLQTPDSGDYTALLFVCALMPNGRLLKISKHIIIIIICLLNDYDDVWRKIFSPSKVYYYA